MSDISTVGTRLNGADLEFYDKASGNTVLAFRQAIGSLAVFSAVGGLTAHAGGGQANALGLTSGINRVSTVATAGDSVALPAATPGALVTVINGSANPLQVFGNGTDVINGVAAATGVSQMQASAVVYTCSPAGFWHTIGLGGGYNGSLPTSSYANAITAHAGGGQASAVPLVAVINRITTVATAADSVLLPPAIPGTEITVNNAAAAHSLNIFPCSAAEGGIAGGDAINAGGANAAYALAAGSSAFFSCAVLGTWHAISGS